MPGKSILLPARVLRHGKQRSPYGIHFSYDTYALAHGTGNVLIKSGGGSWFFMTADYAFERHTASAVKAAGGKVLGSVRAPLTIAPEGAWRPLAEGGCLLINGNSKEEWGDPFALTRGISGRQNAAPDLSHPHGFRGGPTLRLGLSAALSDNISRRQQLAILPADETPEAFSRKRPFTGRCD
jgi:Periplasmic binding protein